MARLEDRIKMVREATGFVDEEADRAVEQFEGWTYGDRVRVIEENEDAGVFEGDEGYVIIGEVGAAEYRNLRTSLNILVDGTDCPIEIRADAIEEA